MSKDYTECFKQACKNNNVDIKDVSNPNNKDIYIEINKPNKPILLEDKIKERLKDLVGVKEEFIVEIDYNDITVKRLNGEIDSLRQEVENLKDEINELNLDIAELNGC